MKTLDEVIAEMEYEAKYNSGEQRSYDADALHYLKLFQTHVQRVRGQLDDLKEEYRPNDPLTWDELTQMEGKPVWVENQFYKRWLIAYKVNREDIIFDGNGFYTQAFSVDYGKAWQAYRKERS